MYFYLLLQNLAHPEECVNSFPLNEGINIVGRSHTANIRLPHPDVSGRHFSVTLTEQTAIIENLSTHGTSVNGDKIVTPVELQPESVIIIGRGVMLKYMCSDTPIVAGVKQLSNPMDEKSSATVIGDERITLDPRHVSSPELIANDGITMFGLDDKSADSNVIPENSDITSFGETQVLQTRIALPEEIEFIKQQKKAAIKKRLTFRVMIFAALGIIPVLMLSYGNRREKTLDWSEALLQYAAPVGGGHLKGKYSVIYPKYPKSQVSCENDSVHINTFIGRDGIIPFNIECRTEKSLDWLNVDRNTAFNNWMSKQNNSSDSRWNFGTPSDQLKFAGSDNGFPYLSATYRRENDGVSWFGIVNFFRNGMEQIVMTLEVPAIEEYRAKAAISKNAYLLPSNDYLDTYWEGFPSISEVDQPEKQLELLKIKLAQASLPSLYSLEREFCRLLFTCIKHDEYMKYYGETLGQLKYLRQRLKNGFNLLKIKYYDAKTMDDEKALNQVKNEGEAIFKNKADKRHYDVVFERWQ